MTCTKTAYTTEKAANDDILRIKKKSKRATIPFRSYLCPNCGAWHLTSQEDKKTVAIRELQKENLRLQQELLAIKQVTPDDRLKIKRDAVVDYLKKGNQTLNITNQRLRKDNQELMMKNLRLQEIVNSQNKE